MERDLSSAAAFVEGGIQDACDDACSICLESFSESDPSTVTSCKHEFHLQCILEWCQRSAQCPMCWQPISFKDSVSQDLLSDVESERNIRLNRTRNSTFFHHPALVDLDLPNFPVGGSDAELEERIFQHLAAAAAMGRAQHIARRDGQRSLSGSHGRPQYFIFSPHSDAPSIGSVSSSTAPPGESELSPAVVAGSQLASLAIPEENSANQDLHVLPTSADLSSRTNTSPSGTTSSRSPAGQSTPINRDRPGPSDIQSFSESLKSRLNAVSLRYKESITKSTRGWRDKLFSRNSSVADLGSEVKREVNATVSRVMDRLESREHQRSADSSPSPAVVACPTEESINEGPTQIQNSATGQPNDITSSTSHLASSSAS